MNFFEIIEKWDALWPQEPWSRFCLNGFEFSKQLQGVKINYVTSDSRLVKSDVLGAYVAIKGGTFDGHQFIENAFKKGAAIVFGEDSNVQFSANQVYLPVQNTRTLLARFSAILENLPSANMLMIGITGTSGKTTTSYLIEAILRQAGYKVGVIGTNGIRYENHTIEATHTTPGPEELQKILSLLKSRGANAVVMEVSSHALHQSRVEGVFFDVAVFKNLSPEHLDYHSTMIDYFEAKALLFSPKSSLKKLTSVVNASDEFGKKLIERLQKFGLNNSLLTYSTQPLESRESLLSKPLQFEDVKIGQNAIEWVWDDYKVKSQLIGLFNWENILSATQTAIALNINKNAIIKALEEFCGVPGRMERVQCQNANTPLVIVDYAHKPDALEKVLQTLEPMKLERNGKIITVFGCGGNRDKQKRPLMGKIAAKYSDYVVVTSDNPRDEKPEEIISEIVAGIDRTIALAKVRTLLSREKAIEVAIAGATPKDIVLIAGKGHESYQIIDGKTFSFDDRQVAAKVLDTSF